MDTPALLDPSRIAFDPYGLVGSLLPLNTSKYAIYNAYNGFTGISFDQIDDLGNNVHPEAIPADWHEGSHRDALWGSSGNDLIKAGRGTDYAWGMQGDDLITGGSDAEFLGYVDRLDGGAGNDTIFGNDIVDLGALASTANFGGYQGIEIEGASVFTGTDDREDGYCSEAANDEFMSRAA